MTCHYRRPIACRSVLRFEPQLDLPVELVVGLLRTRRMQKDPGKNLREEFWPVTLASDTLMVFNADEWEVNPVVRELHRAASRQPRRTGGWIDMGRD